MSGGAIAIVAPLAIIGATVMIVRSGLKADPAIKLHRQARKRKR